MKCNCSLTNEYEIEGLCDIQKFNEKMNSSIDESWTQVSISDNIILSEDKPSIKTITKVILDVKIISNKIINSPKSHNPNAEEMNLTGKLLLISGEIIQKVFYVSNNSNLEKINSLKINTPFTTYIVIDEDVDINQDKYCISPCVEYASLRPINDNSLSQNINMFLFAKIVPKPFNNDIIFKNENNQELAKIKFDSNTNMLEVISTKANNDNKILKFELYKKHGTTLRKQGTINANTNAEKFAKDLNNQKFHFNDVINISYEDKQRKVLIKNFPNMGEEYNPIIDKNEAFRITRKGLVPYTLPNKIILNDENNQKIVELSFSKFLNKLRVISTRNTAPNRFGRKDYFKVTLNNTMPKGNFIGIILGNENGNRLKNRLDDKHYSIGDTIDIFCEEGNKVEITNYPDKHDNYNLKQKIERFKITAKGLEKIDIPPYQNEIILKNSRSQELARVKFDVITSALEVTSTGNRASANDDFTVKLIKATSRDEFQGIIAANQDGGQFKIGLNDKEFSFGDVIQINSEIPTKAEITNYPDKGNIYNLTQDLERFRITEMGLIKIPIIARYANEIKLQNERNQELATILFDTITNVLRINPQRANVNDAIPIRVELYQEDGRTLNEFGEILGNTGATQFVESLEGVFFKYGDIINIIYNSKPNKIEIDDYPTQGRQYNPKLDTNEAFVITESGLQLYAIKDKIVSANGGNDLAEIYFSKLNNKIKVFSSGRNAPNKQGSFKFSEYFSLILFRENQDELIAKIPYSQNANAFKQALELQSYSIGDTLLITSELNFTTRLEDVITGVITITSTNVMRYKITENGLLQIPTVYPNDIIFKNDSNQEIAVVRFGLTNKKLFVRRTDNFISSGSGRPALQFRLYAPDGTTLKANGIISERSQAVSFVSDLNDKPYNFGDIIVLGYGNYPRRVSIDNFPNIGNIYTPVFVVSESFIIKETGLVKYTLQNSITLLDRGGNIIVDVNFQRIPKALKIISTTEITPSAFARKDYFKVKLKNSNPPREFTGIIEGNQTGSMFKAALDNKTYEVGDVIEIFCEEPNKVKIRNFPNIGQDYTPTQKTESFRITETKLEKINT